jgi:hypothetical protein
MSKPLRICLAKLPLVLTVSAERPKSAWQEWRETRGERNTTPSRPSRLWPHCSKSQPWLEGKEPNVETEMCAGGGHLSSVDERDPRFGRTMGNRSLLF